jgi:hypothetical protein
MLVELVSGLLDEMGDDALRVRVDSIDVDLPVEARIAQGGTLLAGPVRTRLRTGFEVPLGRVSARLRRTA